jgi:tripartite-type tricarboxylate transporter receptor subunit TctC
MDRNRRVTLKFASLLLFGAGFARAQGQYPVRPIRYIVPVSPGGGADMIARVVTERWAKSLGQPIVVDNQSGASGVIACQSTMRAAADGYTLLQGYVATHGTNPATRKVPYDPIRDFTAIGMIGGTPNVLVVGASVPPRNLAEFIEYVRRNPGKITYGSAGQGSLTHLTMELFSHQLDLAMVHVPYRGIAPAFTDLLGGQTQVMFPGLAAAMPHIRSGRAIPLAVTGSARHHLLRHVPTLEEGGLKGFDAMQWYGVVGPAGIPSGVVTLLNEKLNAVLAAADLRERLSAEAVEPMPMTPEQFSAFIKTDIARWSKLAKDRHIDLEN